MRQDRQLGTVGLSTDVKNKLSALVVAAGAFVVEAEVVAGVVVVGVVVVGVVVAGMEVVGLSMWMQTSSIAACGSVTIR